MRRNNPSWVRKRINLIRRRVDDLYFLCGYIGWVWQSYYRPRPIGTTFVKSKWGYDCHYEVVGYTPNKARREIVELIKKVKK